MYKYKWLCRVCVCVCGSVDTVNWSVKRKQPAGSTLRSDWLRQQLHYVTSYFTAVFLFMNSKSLWTRDFFKRVFLFVHHSRRCVQEHNVYTDDVGGSLNAPSGRVTCWIWPCVILTSVFLSRSYRSLDSSSFILLACLILNSAINKCDTL